MYMFDLDVGDVDETLGEHLARACSRADHWPVDFVAAREERRWFGVRKAFPAVLEVATVDGELHALPARHAVHDDAVPLAPGVPARLAQTIRRIAEAFPEGFTFRAARADAPVRLERTVTTDELVDLVDRNVLDGHARYTVGSSPAR